MCGIRDPSGHRPGAENFHSFYPIFVTEKRRKRQGKTQGPGTPDLLPSIFRCLFGNVEFHHTHTVR